MEDKNKVLINSLKKNKGYVSQISFNIDTSHIDSHKEYEGIIREVESLFYNHGCDVKGIRRTNLTDVYIKKQIIIINGNEFVLNFDFDGGSDGMDLLKYHNFYAESISNNKLFYEIQVVLSSKDEKHNFAIEVFPLDENGDVKDGEWFNLDYIITDERERKIIENIVIVESDNIINRKRRN